MEIDFPHCDGCDLIHEINAMIENVRLPELAICLQKLNSIK